MKTANNRTIEMLFIVKLIKIYASFGGNTKSFTQPILGEFITVDILNIQLVRQMTDMKMEWGG